MRVVSIIALIGAPVPAFAQAQAQAGVAAREAARRALPYLEKEVQCNGCKTRAVVGAVVNRKKIIRGSAAIGGPMRNETTPAYCNKENGRQVCYDSQGQRAR